jgi:hypothetical protein
VELNLRRDWKDIFSYISQPNSGFKLKGIVTRQCPYLIELPISWIILRNSFPPISTWTSMHMNHTTNLLRLNHNETFLHTKMIKFKFKRVLFDSSFVSSIAQSVWFSSRWWHRSPYEIIKLEHYRLSWLSSFVFAAIFFLGPLEKKIPPKFGEPVRPSKLYFF